MEKKIIIACDSFKGSLPAKEVCRIIATELHSLHTEVSTTQIPIADGGEGTVDTYLQVLGGKRVFVTTCSPLNRIIKANYGLIGDMAVIETAAASGITTEHKKDAMKASSYGTGILIKDALDKGVNKIVIGLGSSATTDGGTGLLSALGVDFYDENMGLIYPCGENLDKIEYINTECLDPRIFDVEITALCDVKNVLFGKTGASYVYAPQKGANEQEVKVLDMGLKNFARLSATLLEKDYSKVEGSGAAGGLGFALIAYLEAQLVSGIDTMLKLCEFEEKARQADLIITGEGKMDEQSLMGKVTFGVAKKASGTKVVAIVGVNELPCEKHRTGGIHTVIETNANHLPFEDIRLNAHIDLQRAVQKLELA